uniref:Uncharacterized protein n=1 Tax=Rhizophagus irregularis (strain DAOM 181602 / DAOM 197198 / MUCL 43194) TaxID=747089 RepID=U9ULA1_RHIID
MSDIWKLRLINLFEFEIFDGIYFQLGEHLLIRTKYFAKSNINSIRSEQYFAKSKTIDQGYAAKSNVKSNVNSIYRSGKHLTIFTGLFTGSLKENSNICQAL